MAQPRPIHPLRCPCELGGLCAGCAGGTGARADCEVVGRVSKDQIPTADQKDDV